MSKRVSEPVSKRSPWRRVLCYFPRYRWALSGGVACILASRLLMVWAPLLLREALRTLEAGGPDTVRGATAAAWAFLGVSAAAGAFTWAQRLLLIGASRRVERDLKQALFAHMESLPIAWFDRMRTGDLLSRLTSDVEAVRFVVGPGPMYVASTLVMFPLALLAMFRLSVPTTLVVLAPLLAIALLVRWTAPGIMRRSRAVQDQIGDLAARAQESFAGARVVRAYATEDVEIEAFAAENRAMVAESLALATRRAILQGGIHLLGGLAELAVLVYGGLRVLDGSLGLGDLGAYLAYVGMLIWPMISVGWVVSAVQRAAAAIQRIDEVLSEPAEARVRGGEAIRPGAVRGAIRVDRLTFRFPGQTRPAIEDLSLEIPAGKTLALVGPVGGGKSSVVSVLTRLYEPPPGTVFLDGMDVTRLPLEELRRAFTVVPQDPFLFSDTLRGNLAYGTEEDVPPERLREAASVAGLDADLAVFPRGLETVVGERGVTLSGGQKQRATLARALLRPAPVLVLDDALSSVDTQTEARILDRLEGELRRHTVVLVAHRLSTVRHADRIVVLDGGRAVEAGTHEYLLSRGGWYARTYDRQRLEAAIEEAR